jgi:hypothetical protein
MYKIKNILFLLVSGLFVTACNLFEPEMDNIYYSDRVMKDPAFAEGLLLNAYTSLPNEFSFNDVATDDAVTNNKQSSYLRMATGGWTAMYNPENEWTRSYGTIFYLNQFLSVIDNVKWSWQSTYRDSLFRARLTGEALAFRAYYHFLILMKHGGVDASGAMMGIPVVKSVVDPNGTWKLKRSTYAETVQEIIADLDTAYKKLPLDYANKNAEYDRINGAAQKGRISGRIVRALRARISLYVASPAYNSGTYNAALCEDATKAVEDVIGATKLPSSGLNFFDDDNDITNAEIVWRRDYTTIRTWEEEHYPPSMYGRGRINPTQNLVDAFPMKNGKPITDPTSGYSASNPYTNRDPRLAAYIVYNGNKIGNTTINTNKESTTNGLNNTETSTRTGYYLKKLLRPDVNLTPGAQNTRRHFMPLVRFTELYLIYAEAANELWGPDSDPKGYGLTARAAVSEIRKRAGIDAADTYLASVTTKEAMRELIRNERRLELCFEGYRFWDMRRWGLPLNQKVTGMSIENNVYSIIDVEERNFADYMQFGPLPFNEILKNDQLVQNKGW